MDGERMNDSKICPDCKQVVIWDWWARCDACAHITDNCVPSDCFYCKEEEE